MNHPMPRRLALAAAFLVVAFVAVLPSASAAAVPDVFEAVCPVLPLWDAAFCWAGVALALANYAYGVVTCDVVGGPACGFDICADTGICLA